MNDRPTSSQNTPFKNNITWTTCFDCGQQIPHFASLTETELQQLIELIDAKKGVLAMQGLMQITGCSINLAKLWVNHRGGLFNPANHPPCPLCGKPLRTSTARQCRHCHHDWHQEE
ncbi:MAG: hypothetical protein HY774_09945 [Acidobacteria bacterium]|nr:hypothetical protein [Acidobacteriota bacterium]